MEVWEATGVSDLSVGPTVGDSDKVDNGVSVTCPGVIVIETCGVWVALVVGVIDNSGIPVWVS